MPVVYTLVLKLIGTCREQLFADLLAWRQTLRVEPVTDPRTIKVSAKWLAVANLQPEDQARRADVQVIWVDAHGASGIGIYSPELFWDYYKISEKRERKQFIWWGRARKPVEKEKNQEKNKNTIKAPKLNPSHRTGSFGGQSQPKEWEAARRLQRPGKIRD